MATKDQYASVYPIESAERLIKIMGDGCATAHALAEMKRRQAEGEDVTLLISGSWIFVGPPTS